MHSADHGGANRAKGTSRGFSVFARRQRDAGVLECIDDAIASLNPERPAQ